MKAGIRRYERINPDIEVDSVEIQLDPRGHTPEDQLNTADLANSSDVENSTRKRHVSKSSKNRKPIRRERREGRKDWRFGLYAGMCASTIALFCNLAALVFAVVKTNSAHGGLATIMQGGIETTSRVSTLLHIFINVLSTVLLTSSNFAMQLLCAPTPREISQAHQNGQWLEIGLMSFRNLRKIEKKRALVWWVLALSSAPLHLFYNSAVFLFTSGQDYSIKAITETESHNIDPDTWTNLSNSEWTALYSSSYVSKYSDLLLVVNNASSKMTVHSNWTITFETPSLSMCNLQSFNDNQLNIPVVFNDTTSTYDPRDTDDYRVIFPLSSNATYSFNITQNWPEFPIVNASSSYTDALTFCGGTGWIESPSHAALHVMHAHAKVRSHINGVQIGIPFLSIVIVANIFKMIGIFFALRFCSSGHVITVGDAIATFLKTPEADTEGKCTLSQRQIIQVNEIHHPQPWIVRKKQTMSIIGGRRMGTAANFLLGIGLTTMSLTLALMKTGGQTGWGTASKFIISATSTSFDAKGAFLIAFLANLPQAMLSFFYFFVNRLCTSICFAQEWNNFAVNRKSLRVTAPSGQQRSTHFLQLPLRWAMPLTAMSGAIHWLLSQSLFLVRQEKWSYDNTLYPDSTCACGYSALSLLVFAGVFFTMIGTVGSLLMRHVEIHLPPARHCSLVISAACHPPSGDLNCHLRSVQWGLVAEATESRAGHCTFTSQSVQKPREGNLYN